MHRHPLTLLAFLAVFFSTTAHSQLPEHWDVVPLDAGSRGTVQPNANNIIFFPHPVIPGSLKNFGESPSHIVYDGQREIDVGDLAGAPGFLPESPEHQNIENIRSMLADPADLCYDDLLRLTCGPEVVLPNQLSWQQLVADLRNYLPTETARVSGLAPQVQNVTLAGLPGMWPYNEFGLGSLIINPLLLGEGRESPPAICYDIVQMDDWIACPVFGKIFVRGHPAGPITPEKENVELESPVLIYREEDSRYHLAGYLANPTHYDYQLYGPRDEEDRRYHTQHYFPVAIAAGRFSAATGSNIAVMSTATQPHATCHMFNQKLEEAGFDGLPWGLKCTYGITWVRRAGEWTTPRGTFEPLHVLIGAPKIYDLAVGEYAGKQILFAPSNEPTSGNKFYILKYYEEVSSIEGPSAWGEFIPPKLIEVEPPQDDRSFGPFKMATSHVNDDLYSDFALTWKKTEDEYVGNNMWKGNYSSFVSVFLSRLEEGQIIYRQFDFPIPDSQLAAVAFGKYQNQDYLVVGNNRRVQTEDGYHAFAYFFPIRGGVVEDVSTMKTVKVSFNRSESQETPGVGDLTTDQSGLVASAIRDPFIPAPETCEAGDGNGVYGYRWLGEVRQRGERIKWFDFDHDGIPNRCECDVLPNETNDPDFDELANDELTNVEGCDDCPALFNLDWETNEEGIMVGDGVADACDNCPPTRCASLPVEGMNCINPKNEDDGLQVDSDGDGMGDTCDACPNSADLVNSRGIYASGTECLEFCGTGIDCCTPNFCTHCAFGYLMPDGRTRWYTEEPKDLNNGCENEINGPYTGGIPDIDRDGVPDARDNCVYISNPAPESSWGSAGNEPSGQADSDNDGSGNACDCSNAGRWDDCDSDGVPNRFDREPTNPAVSFNQPQPPDSVYDPYAAVIADIRQLKPAQSGNTLIQLNQFEEQMEERMREIIRINPLDDSTSEQEESIGGYPEHTFPGPDPYDYMGPSGREVTVILPTTLPPPPHQCIPEQDPDCTPHDPDHPEARQVSQYCIAKVGRENKKTAAIFTEDQERIIQANDQARAITGIPEFDIFAGADGGIIHWECVFAAGAYVPDVAAPDTARAITFGAAAPQEMNAQVAPFLLAQLSGLPPIRYEARPDLRFEIKEPQAMILAPVIQEGVPSPELPNLNIVLPDRQLSRISAEGVQVGELRENIHGNMVFKVLHAGMDVSAEGTAMAVNDLQSLVVIDYKTYPEPFTGKPIEQRMYNVNYLLSELQKKVEKWKQEGKRITVDIYRDLPWEDSMRVEFLLAQGTVLEAVETLNEAAGVEPSVARVVNVGSSQLFEALPPGHTNSIILPLYSKASGASLGGSGCGCRVSSGELALAELLLLLCLFAPVPVLLYYRQRTGRKHK